jgi:hypothetical protein
MQHSLQGILTGSGVVRDEKKAEQKVTSAKISQIKFSLKYQRAYSIE